MKQELNYTPDQSWLSGKYPDINAEIDTRLPFVEIGDYYWQGWEADKVISEIHQIWLTNDCTTQEAIEKYALSLP